MSTLVMHKNDPIISHDRTYILGYMDVSISLEKMGNIVSFPVLRDTKHWYDRLNDVPTRTGVEYIRLRLAEDVYPAFQIWIASENTSPEMLVAPYFRRKR